MENRAKHMGRETNFGENDDTGPPTPLCPCDLTYYTEMDLYTLPYYYVTYRLDFILHGLPCCVFVCFFCPFAVPCCFLLPFFFNATFDRQTI